MTIDQLTALVLILGAFVVLGLVVLVGLHYRFVSAVLSDQRELTKDLVGKALLYQKSETAEEAVTLDINAEAYKDALAKAEYEEQKDKKDLAPKYAHTDDGRRIDLREWELL